MGRQSKFIDEQKLAIVLDLLSAKLSHSEVCRKYGISSTYAYELKDRALEILGTNIGHPLGKPDAVCERLKKRVENLVAQQLLQMSSNQG